MGKHRDSAGAAGSVAVSFRIAIGYAAAPRCGLRARVGRPDGLRGPMRRPMRHHHRAGSQCGLQCPAVGCVGERAQQLVGHDGPWLRECASRFASRGCRRGAGTVRGCVLRRKGRDSHRMAVRLTRAGADPRESPPLVSGTNRGSWVPRGWRGDVWTETWSERDPRAWYYKSAH
eukprot:2328659-Prymnesium_polylepis.2